MRVEAAGRVLRTVSHLDPNQVWHRARLTARRALWPRLGARIDARYEARAASGRVRWDHPGLLALARARSARRAPESALFTAEDAAVGRFTLLGETLDLGRPVAWDRPDLAHRLLWKTHLHEQGWSFDLALAARDTGEARLRDTFFALLRDYLASQPIAKPGFQTVAWNERVVATRLVHWAAAGALLDLRDGDRDADWLGRQIVRHALFLRDNLALDLRANHLFRDCVALACAHELSGCVPDGLVLLEREVNEQILPDGGHYEGSAMYHAVCLEDLFDLHLLLGKGAPPWLTDAVRRAGGFLEGVLLGDDDIPLLGDAWRGEVDPRLLLEQVRSSVGTLVAPREPERWSGLARVERGPLRAVIRLGPHGPDHQLGHAHADLLSFELSRGMQRVVVDTGTGAYAAGPVRQRLRSTAAHNTVQIDGQELLEAWSSFRSGRRGRARCHGRGECGPWSWIAGSHDGYAWLPGSPVPHRLLAIGADAVLVLDAVLGSRPCHVASRLHLHPGADAAAVRVFPFGGALHTGVAPYHEHFGRTEEMTELTLEAKTALPWLGGFWLRFGALAPPAVELAWEDGVARLALQDGEHSLALRWRPATASVEIGVLGSGA
jgi:uncharacterized heparinase superfamily protein